MILLLAPLLLGALLALLFRRHARRLALIATLAALGLGSWLLATGQWKREFVGPTIRLLGAQLQIHTGADGMSLVLVLLALLLGVAVVLVSDERHPAYYALLLLVLSSVIGVFVSMHLVLFFLFWELVLVLMFLLILRWGHENRKYAAMKFLVYTGIGSAGLLFSIVLLAANGSTDMLAVHAGGLPRAVRLAIFWPAILAFLVKMPVVPFHTWLPDAHVQAPTAGSMLLAGLLLKMGAYGLIRFGSFFPGLMAEYKQFFFILGLVSMIYAGLVCLAQFHLKRLIAYSSVNHMGLVLIGISTMTGLGRTGAVYAMVSHGLIAALLFGLAGEVYRRLGTFDLLRIRGLLHSMPGLGWLIMVAGLAGMGLPTMTGFVAEFIVLVAAYRTFGTAAIPTLVGVLLTGAYTIRLITKTCFGRSERREKREETALLLPYVVLVLVTLLLGTVPSLLLGLIGVGP